MTTQKTPQVFGALTDKGLNLVIDNVPHTINKDHYNYEQILTALRSKDYSKVVDLIDVKKSIETFSNELVKVVNGEVTYRGQPIHNTLTKRMLEMLRLGLDIKPMALFLINLMQNPSHRAVTELYPFMEACDLPITADGELLVYRSVNEDYWDRHTGGTAFSKPFKEDGDNPVFERNGCISTIINGFRTVEVERNSVDDNPNNTCSKGLHVCSQKYGMYGSRLLLCSVNPRDVVSVPNEYNSAKMRVCRYRVIRDCTEGFKDWSDKPVYSEDNIKGSLNWNPNDDNDEHYDVDDDDYWDF